MLRLTVLLLSLLSLVHSFAPAIVSRHPHFSPLYSSTPSTTAQEYIKTDKPPSDEWELDCYSRPVLVNGKKLWEVLLIDSTGSFRFLRALPSNQVNSRQLRQIVEQVMDEADVKPTTIRFFRGAMFNMVRCGVKKSLAVLLSSLSYSPSACSLQ